MKTIVCKWTVLLVLTFMTSQADCQDTIYWRKDNKLTWSDFKGEPVGTSRHRAVTSSGIAYSWSLPDTGAYFKTAAFFVTNRSWTKSVKDTNTLNHEQGHFDITEIYARKLLASLQQLNRDKKATKQSIAQVAEKTIAQKNDFQKQYDFETSFGINREAQKKWDELILAQLSQ